MQVNTTYQQLKEGLQSFIKSINLDHIKSYVDNSTGEKFMAYISGASAEDIGYYGFANCVLCFIPEDGYGKTTTVSCCMKVNEEGKLVSSIDNGGKFKERTNEDLLNTMLTVYECKYT